MAISWAAQALERHAGFHLFHHTVGDSDLQGKVMSECVQLFGGYGYMWEYPITRAYADARVSCNKDSFVRAVFCAASTP